MQQRLRTLFRTAFTDLAWPKKRLLQLALGLLGFGVLTQGWAAFAADGAVGQEGWSLSALRSGGGCLAGFVVGAFLRLFLKLGLLVAGVLGAGAYGLSAMGVVDLPWESFGEASAAMGDWVRVQTANLEQFFSGYLPSGALTGAGVASGATQSPSLDDDEDD